MGTHPIFESDFDCLTDMSDYEGLSRVVTIKKKKSDGLGFKLKNDPKRKGNIVSDVSSTGPAGKCGLLVGDRIIAIKKKNVQNSKHADVVAEIKKYAKKDTIQFTVVAAACDPVNPDRDEMAESSGEKIFNVQKIGTSYGFSLSTVKNGDEYRHIIKDIKAGGAAQKAGMENKMILIAMNGRDCVSLGHKEVVQEVKSGGKNVIIRCKVVTEEEIAEKIAEKAAEVAPVASTMPAPEPETPVVAAPSASGKAKICRVVKSPRDNYGFSCKYEKEIELETVNRIAIGSPAQLAGLENGDRIYAVNGTKIVGLSHAETIALIKTYENHVVFLAVPEAHWTAGMSVSEASAVPQWESNYGELGIPRNVTLEREPGERYGFTIEYVNKQHVVKAVGDHSPAAKAGLNIGDIVWCINKADVSKMGHSEALNHVRENPDQVQMTVVDEKAVTLYTTLNIDISHELTEELQVWKASVEEETPVAAVMPAPEEPEVEPEVEAEPEPEPEEEKIIEHPVAAAVVASKIIENKRDDEEEPPKPRLVTLVKDQGYGFFLQDQDGHYLNQISPGEPADLAGVKDNDGIVEINGTNVESATHAHVVDLIRESGDKVSFLIVDKETDEYYKSRDILITSALLGIVHNAPKARLCKLVKQESGFGFEVHSEKTDDYGNAQFLRNIMEGGAAEKAGIQEHDRLIEINKTKTAGLEHGDIVGLIKGSGDTMIFLVADAECSEYYHSKGVTITEEHADPLYDPPTYDQQKSDPVIEHPVAAAAVVAAAVKKATEEDEPEPVAEPVAEPEPEPEAEPEPEPAAEPEPEPEAEPEEGREPIIEPEPDEEELKPPEEPEPEPEPEP